jgi:hypothetical protein
MIALWLGLGCGDREGGGSTAAGGGASWLQGSTDERFALVAGQLRGFDMAMVEVGYRYGELYWAGQDRNWGFADYQLEKIGTAIANGLVRRPKRAESARMIEGPLAGVREAVETEDPRAFADAFEALTTTCNLCHQAEKMPFVVVREPTIRLSPVHAVGVPAPPAEVDDAAHE